MLFIGFLGVSGLSFMVLRRWIGRGHALETPSKIFFGWGGRL